MKAGYIAGVLCAIAALTAPVASYPATPGPSQLPAYASTVMSSTSEISLPIPFGLIHLY